MKFISTYKFKYFIFLASTYLMGIFDPQMKLCGQYTLSTVAELTLLIWITFLTPHFLCSWFAHRHTIRAKEAYFI